MAREGIPSAYALSTDLSIIDAFYNAKDDDEASRMVQIALKEGANPKQSAIFNPALLDYANIRFKGCLDEFRTFISAAKVYIKRELIKNLELHHHYADSVRSDELYSRGLDIMNLLAKYREMDAVYSQTKLVTQMVNLSMQPLHIAVSFGYEKTTKLLLAYGSDPTSRCLKFSYKEFSKKFHSPVLPYHDLIKYLSKDSALSLSDDKMAFFLECTLAPLELIKNDEYGILVDLLNTEFFPVASVGYLGDNPESSDEA